MNKYRLKYYPDQIFEANNYQFGMEDGFLNKEKGLLAPRGTYPTIRDYGEIQRNNGFYGSWIPYINTEDEKRIYLDSDDIIGFFNGNKYRFTEKEFYEFFIPYEEE